MNSEQSYLEFLEESAKNAFLMTLVNDFGDNSIDALSNLTKNIRVIYKHLRIRNFKSITIYSPFADKVKLKSIAPSYLEVINSEAFSSIECSHLVIEVTENKIYYCTDWEIEIDKYRSQSIIYRNEKNKEMFYGKTECSFLPYLPDAESYFQFTTFKDLEQAFEEYEQKRAKYSSCPFLEMVWHPSKRILLVPRPEEIMQKSLYDFLSVRLRGSPEVMPEQNVDRSHPVDIKVTWKFNSHVALIEIKWLGKSLKPSTQRIVTRTDVDARNGADQLANYLEVNKQFSRTKIVSGYLVVFDGRRRRVNKDTEVINQHDGTYYRNRNIVYNIKHEEIREDFEKPRRFFMEPITL